MLMETSLGDITLRLYDETPLHRDNFIRLVNEGFYDGLLFHRVIRDFMIQGGDPDSRGAKAGTVLGNGGPGYTIPAEIRPGLFHKKGALAAARMGDRENPDQASSGSQFYIVEGKVLNDEELDKAEQRINQMRQQALFYKYLRREQEENAARDNPLPPETLQENAMMKTQENLLESGPYKIPEDEKEVYRTIGGTPHLDGNYTVFGEVVSGLEVVDRIASVSTDEHDRPLDDVRIIHVRVLKNAKRQ